MCPQRFPSRESRLRDALPVRRDDYRRALAKIQTFALQVLVPSNRDLPRPRTTSFFFPPRWARPAGHLVRKNVLIFVCDFSEQFRERVRIRLRRRLDGDGFHGLRRTWNRRVLRSIHFFEIRRHASCAEFELGEAGARHRIFHDTKKRTYYKTFEGAFCHMATAVRGIKPHAVMQIVGNITCIYLRHYD